MRTHSFFSWLKNTNPLWLLLLLLILVRLPLLNRPLSKHDDFNTAVILINAISWQQAGGGAKFHYTPLMNFQGHANKILEQGFHIDAQGNQVYLSFGAGWYVLPYAICQLLQLTPSPLLLQWISILIGCITALLLFTFLQRSTGSPPIAFMGTLLFTCLPAVLWYTGVSYVTTGIMLPLVIWILWLWWRLAKQPQPLGIGWFLQLVIATLLLTYIDWVSVFLVGSMVVWAIVNIRKNRNGFWVAIIGIAAAGLAIFLILWQYASYLGWQQVLGYWHSRFGERNTTALAVDQVKMSQVFLRFMAAGYGPLILTFLLISFRKKFQLPAAFRWIYFAMAGVGVYNFVFLNWSIEHEFAWLTMALVLSIYLCFLCHKTIVSKRLAWWMVGYGCVSVAIYFYVNKPGPNSRNGDAYNSSQLIGQRIAATVTANAFIFTNLPNAKLEEYYARRSFNVVGQLQQAQKIADSLHISNAYWLTVTANHTLEIFPLRQP